MATKDVAERSPIMTTDRRAELLARVKSAQHRVNHGLFLGTATLNGLLLDILAALNEAPQAAQPGGVEELAQQIFERHTPRNFLGNATWGVTALNAIREALTTPPKGNVPAFEDGALRAHIAEQITFAETRIQDGIAMGATIWRLALEDIVRENRAALSPDTHAQGADK